MHSCKIFLPFFCHKLNELQTNEIGIWNRKACLSSLHYRIDRFAQACIRAIKILSFLTRKWPASLGFPYLVFAFPSTPLSFLFTAVVDLLLGFLSVYWDRKGLPRNNQAQLRPTLVKGDDVRSETKTNARGGNSGLHRGGNGMRIFKNP